MDFFDEMYKKVSDVASYTAKEAEKLTGVAKLKYSLMREKSKLEDSFKEMGELYYSQMKYSELDEKKLSIAYDKIEKNKVEIDRLTGLICELTDTKICAFCENKLSKDMAFCPRCGANQTPKDEAKDTE